MKTNLLLTMGLLLSLTACEKKVDNYIYLQVPDKADAKVYTEDLRSYTFRFDADMGDGWYRYNCPMEQTLPAGKLAAVYPAADENTYDGKEFHVGINAVQTGNEEVYAATAAMNEQGEWRIACKPVTAKVLFELKSLPANAAVRSVTLRLVAEAGVAGNKFHTAADYLSQALRVSFSDSELRTAMSVYGTDTYALAVFPDDFSKGSFQVEVMLDDATPTGSTHVFAFPGKRIQRGTEHTLTADFAAEHASCASYPIDADYRMSAGVATELNGVFFAPVNLGYKEVSAPFGLTYATDISAFPQGWRLPTEAEMQAVATAERSSHYTMGNAFGYWFGPTAAVTPTNGKNVFLPVGGLTDTGDPKPASYLIWNTNIQKVLYLDTTGKAVIQDAGATAECSVRLVRK